MSDDDKQAARERTRMLVELRKEYSEVVKRAQALMKEQQAVRKVLEKALKDGPCSVPKLAEMTGVRSNEVLWHVASMKKYGIIAEAGTDESGDYFTYALTGEVKQ